MQFQLLLAFVSLASASALIPGEVSAFIPGEARDLNPLHADPNIFNPCIQCGLVCSAVFAAYALLCAVPADPFCEVSLLSHRCTLNRMREVRRLGYDADEDKFTGLCGYRGRCPRRYLFDVPEDLLLPYEHY